MGGLSDDPEKRQRQLDALAHGRRVLAEAVLADDAEPPAAKAPPAAPAKAPAKAAQGSDPDRVTYTEPEEEPSGPEQPAEPEPERPGGDERRGGGFFDGLLGRV